MEVVVADAVVPGGPGVPARPLMLAVDPEEGSSLRRCSRDFNDLTSC